MAEMLSALLMIGVRVSGLMLFAPFLGSASIPPRIKAVLAIVFTALLYPARARLGVVSASQWPLLVGTELLLGIGLGIAASLVFDAVQLAGQVISVQVGYSLVNILDPQTEVESTVLALFHQTIAMLIFLRLDVHYWILRAVANSFAYLPPGTVSINHAFTAAILRVGASVFEVGIQIAAPVLSATLVADVVLGLLGKASPQLGVMLLGPAVKSMLGLTLLVAVLRYWPPMFERLFVQSTSMMERLLYLAR
jgi:flagellar biosynthetic protein FliR